MNIIKYPGTPSIGQTDFKLRNGPPHWLWALLY